MSSAFHRSMRSLAADGFRRSLIGMLLSAILLGCWFSWLFLAKVTLYKVTDSARLEVDQAVYPVQAAGAGRVVATSLVLDHEVQVSEVLVELDGEIERLQHEEEQARLVAFARQLEVLRNEVTAREEAHRQEKATTRATLDEARARDREAQTAAQFAGEEAERLTRLYARGHVPELDLLRAKAEAQKRRAAADALALTISRLEKERLTKESDMRAQLESLKRQVALLEGEIMTAQATMARLKEQIEKRRIRAPISGRLGEITYLRTGSFVNAGDTLAVVVPGGKLKVVADFLPSAALGRIQPGQAARLRLEGFPWTQYGSISAKVTTVASETRDGRVRVELAVLPNSASPIPFQHGLPGMLEVEVEQVSPATLLLRLVGKMIAAPVTTTTSETNHEAKR